MENLVVRSRSAELARQTAIVIAASLVIALCARISIPIPYSPVPLSLVNLAVLAVGLVLGSKRGFAAAALYLANGAAGMPVFSPVGPSGIAHLIGPSGGFLIAYPLVAFVAGWLGARLGAGFLAQVFAATAAEVVLFACGLSWLMTLTHISFMQAMAFGLYPFFFGEVIKVMGAAAIAERFSLKKFA